MRISTNNIRRTLSIGILVGVYALIGTFALAACDSDSEPTPSPVATVFSSTPTLTSTPAPTYTPTATPTPTRVPTPTLTPTPEPYFATSVADYAQRCGMLQLDDEDVALEEAIDYTWGEFVEDTEELVVAFGRLIPPTELEDYHNAHVNVWNRWVDNAQQRPPLDSFDDDLQAFFEDYVDQLIRAALYSEAIQGDLRESLEQAEEVRLREFYGNDTYDADRAAQEILKNLPTETQQLLENMECVPLLYVSESEHGFEQLITLIEPTSPETDREALVALYNATDGPNWTDNTNWLTDSPIGEWFGVRTGDGRVFELDLDGNMLSGSIPAEVGKLTHLEILSLTNNQLRGAIPPEVGDLLYLSHLSLYNNQLTGQIPPELGMLSLLASLLLMNNELSGEIPPELGNLERLWSLWLSGNDLSGCIPAALQRADSSDLVALGLPFCE